MMRVSEKLRAQRSLCRKVRVSIWTGMFNLEEAKYANGMVVDLLHPTDDLVWPPRDYAERLLERRHAASRRAFQWQIGLLHC